MKKQELIQYLDDYLRISDFKDSSKNGLQVDTSQDEIQKIGYSVDMSTYIFERAQEAGVDMILSHHGIYWGHETVLVGVPYQRAKLLLENGIAAYGVHLPLDAHPEVGNNAGLYKAFINIFGLQEGTYTVEDFCEYKGQKIGFGLRFEKAVHISNIVTPYAEQLGLLKKLYNFGEKEYIQSVAFCSGGALSAYKDAYIDGYDLLATGEGSHDEMIAAKEIRQSVLIGGHYETEKIGPKLLAYHLRDRFGLEIEFLDEKY